MTTPSPEELQKPELLPCPFCGSDKITLEWEPCETMAKEDTNRRWFAECTKCSCQGPFCQRETEVLLKWNNLSAAKRSTELEQKLNEWSSKELLGETERCELEALRKRSVDLERENEQLKQDRNISGVLAARRYLPVIEELKSKLLKLELQTDELHNSYRERHKIQDAIIRSQEKQLSQLTADFEHCVEALNDAYTSLDALATFHRHSPVWLQLSVSKVMEKTKEALSLPSAQKAVAAPHPQCLSASVAKK